MHPTTKKLGVVFKNIFIQLSRNESDILKKLNCSSWIFPNNVMGLIVKYEYILICGI